MIREKEGGREIINDRLEGETVEKREEKAEEEERWIVVSTLGCHAMQGKKEVARPVAVALDLFMSCKTNVGGGQSESV